MRKTRFSEDKIIRILGEHEAGRSTDEICREYGISSATFYRWKSKYGGMKQSGRSERRACQLAGISRSVYRYQPIPKHEEAMRARLRELARERPRFGSPRLTVLLRREFGLVNHKRVERLYREEGLVAP